MIHAVRLFLGFATFAMLCNVAMADHIRQVPGTTVSVSISDRFRERDGLAGFVDAQTGASLIVTELPRGAIPQFEKIFSNVGSLNAITSKQGIVFNTIDDIRSADGQKIKLAHGIQDDANGRSDKWMAVFQGTRTALITMQVAQHLAFDPEMVRAVFASVTLGEPPSQGELIERLPFEIDIVEPFRFVGTPTGSGILLMIGADDLNSGSKQPFIIVFRQISEIMPEPLEKLAENQLRSTSSFAKATVRKRTPIEFANSDGVLMEGDFGRDGTKLKFRQYFSITEDGRFIRLVAAAPADQIEPLIPLIERIAGSVEVK